MELELETSWKRRNINTNHHFLASKITIKSLEKCRKWQGTGASRELHNWPAPLGEPARGPRLVGGCIDVLLVVYYS